MLPLKALSQRHLEDAVRLGYITLETGETRVLTAVQIIQISRYILKEGLASSDEPPDASTPVEMFSAAVSLESLQDADADFSVGEADAIDY